MKGSIENIVLLGAGNLASVLGQALHDAGLPIVQVYNRTFAAARQLGQQLSASFTDQINQIESQADLYLICVSDQAIGQLAEQLAFLNSPDRLIVHTSGATPGRIFQKYFDQFGVLYPLQSFSKEKAIDLSSVPFCVDANRERGLRQLEQLAARLSTKVFRINDDQRSLLHVAAVFVNNFSNHLFDLMDRWLEEEQIPFELLQPLILGGAQKIQGLAPKAAQTGPAIRGDIDTIQRHLLILSERRPELVSIYRQFTQSINPNLLRSDDKSQKTNPE